LAISGANSFLSPAGVKGSTRPSLDAAAAFFAFWSDFFEDGAAAAAATFVASAFFYAASSFFNSLSLASIHSLSVSSANY
jgi:hypothetical protein